MEGELYLPGRLRRWELQGKVLTFGPDTALALDGLAVTRFCNNLDRTGDFEPVCSLLDAYNVLLSGAMDDMQSVANAFLALYGMQGTTREDIDRANQSRVLSLAENGKAEFVVKNLSPDAIQLMQETLVRDLLSITMTPDLNDRAFSGNSSGVALEYKLWGIEQCRSAKERGFHPGLLALLEQYACSLTLLGREAAGPVQVHYHKNLPRDLTRLCENLQTLSGILSRRTRLELLPFIPDAEEELRRLKAEAESCGD
jgi:SPP1 family phage portal protein